MTIDVRYPNDAEAMRSLGASRQDFEAWMKELDAQHARRNHPYGAGPLSHSTGLSCWLEFFKDGYNPMEAIEEDHSNW